MGQNTYHRHLNLPFEIKRPKLLEPPFPDDYMHYEMPSHMDLNIMKFFKKVGIVKANIEAFYTPPGGEIPIHCDESTLDNHIKINVTWGPEGGRTRWWDCGHAQSPESPEAILDEFKGAAAAYRQAECLRGTPETCTLLHEASTNKPSIVNVGQMHSTYNPSETEGRWTLCYMPRLPNRDYIYWHEAMQIFKDYISEE